MARALVSIAEEFGGSPLSDATRQELEWSCREVIEAMVQHNYSLGRIIELPEIRARLLLNAFLQREPQGGGRASRVKLQLMPPVNAPVELRERWTQLGFSAEELLVTRPSAQVGLQAGGPGHERASIHHPRGDRGAPPDQTYAYAVSLQSEHQGSYLERYRAGDCERVWTELVGMGEAVRRAAVLADAVAVARETMARCRSNIERLRERLLKLGYQFKEPAQAFVPPRKDVLQQIAGLESRVGPLPLSLCAWYEIVGSVDFRGSHPAWRVEYPDPLFVAPADYILEYDDENWWRGRYRVYIAPDPLHKEDVSGGPPCTIFLPNATVDAPVEQERHNTTFVDYLRTCFRWGGFLGWDESPPKIRPSDALSELSGGLQPI